jgi:hypothetical protein
MLNSLAAMDSQPSFLHLPREVRDMIYSYVLDDVEFSNAFTSQTAYSPQNFTLLYIHKVISEDLQPRLYINHSIVITLSGRIIWRGIFEVGISTCPSGRMLLITNVMNLMGFFILLVVKYGLCLLGHVIWMVA